VSQRPRHEYAADLPHGLPRLVKEPSREVPAARRYGGTHRARPLSARFEPVYGIKDVTTPVPRVLLSATLAGPAPSGSTGHVPALSGLLPPSPAPPGSGCPQLHRPAATRRRRRSLTSTRTTAPAAPGGAASRRSLEAVEKVVTTTLGNPRQPSATLGNPGTRHPGTPARHGYIVTRHERVKNHPRPVKDQAEPGNPGHPDADRWMSTWHGVNW
jgi:hypothetical protein